MDTMIQIQRQENIEMQYNRKHIDQYIRDEIESSEIMQEKIETGINLVAVYMAADYYDSKNKRIAQLQGLCMRTLVTEILVGIAYCQTEELFTSVTAMMAGRLRFSDKLDAIKTIAELLAVLCLTDVFDILKASKSASLVVVSRIPLSVDTLRFIENSQYLPPMVCKPLELENNYSSGYLTHNDSLVLGTGNHHDGDLCLDVLNKLNAIPLALDTQFLSSVEEDPTFVADTPEKAQQWENFKRQSYEFYLLIAQYGNCFHLTHKVDKRGRIYAQGYHLNTQGTAFKKAMVELTKQEVVTGVPA